jgi:hypothetical protein
MHIQAKAKAAKSPPDLEAFFKVLSDPEAPGGQPPREPINIEGVAGDDLETSGYVTFTFDHDRLADVQAWLTEAEYQDVTFTDTEQGEHFQRIAANEPGQLLAAIRDATTQNLAAGRLIKTVLIGQETRAPNRFYVNIAFQEVKR